MATTNFGDNTGNSGSGKDCTLNSFFPTTVFNDTTNEPQNTNNSFPSHSLIAFDLSSLAGPIDCTVAKLWLYKVAEGPSFYTPTFTLHHLRVPFIDSLATWTIAGGADTDWTTAGGTDTTSDIFGTAVASGTLGEALNTYHSIDIDLAHIEDIVANPSTNHGWLLRITNTVITGNDYWRFASDSGTDGQRPYLELVYTADVEAALQESDWLQLEQQTNPLTVSFWG